MVYRKNLEFINLKEVLFICSNDGEFYIYFRGDKQVLSVPETEENKNIITSAILSQTFNPSIRKSELK